MNKQQCDPTPWIADWQRLWGFDNASHDLEQPGQRDFLRTLERLYAEAFDCWKDACHKCLVGAERLGKSRSVEETIAIQTDLVNEAIEQYWHESRKLVELLRDDGSRPHGRSKAARR